MKYYKKDNEVFAFEDDGSQDEYITQDMVRMTSSEVDKHLNPKKYMTDEQLYEIYVKSLRPLTRRQFGEEWAGLEQTQYLFWNIVHQSVVHEGLALSWKVVRGRRKTN